MPQSTGSRSKSSLLLTMLLFGGYANAALSLQALQAIAEFPESCQIAYKTPIQSCPESTAFSLSISGPSSGASICTTDCFSAILQATAHIQKNCRGTSAPPGTVIAHAFTGDLAKFLCTPGSGAGGGGGGGGGSAEPTSNTNPTLSSSSPPQGSSSSAAPTDGDSSTAPTPASSASNTQQSSETATATDAASISSQSASKSSSSSITSTRPTTIVTRSTASTRDSTSAPVTLSSSLSQARPEPTINPGGGGSPFDQTVPNAAPTPIRGHGLLSPALGAAIAVVLVA